MRRVSLLAILAFCVGVSSSSISGCGTEERPEPVPACTAIYRAYLDYLHRCGEPFLPRESEDELALRCDARTALPGIAVGETDVRACASRIAAAACGALPVDCASSYDDAFPRAVGTRTVGEACDIDAQCASGLCGTGVGPCGVCARNVGLGEACGSTALCADYPFRCVDGVCVDTGDPLGAPCSAPKGGSRCQQTLWCPGGSGTCTSRQKIGDACSNGLEECPVGSDCFHGICTLITTVAHGAACSDVARCPAGESCRDGSCYQPRVNVGVGGECGWDYCASWLVCYQMHCYRPLVNVPLGGDCRVDHCLAGLVCGAGAKCALLADVGEPCGGDGACRTGLVCKFDNDVRTCETPAPPAGAGEPCGAIRCAAGLVCASLDSGGHYTCVRHGSPGEPCNTDVPCRAPFVCRYASMRGYESTGVCRALNACSQG